MNSQHKFKTPPFSNISQLSQMYKMEYDGFRTVDVFDRSLEKIANGRK